MPQVVLVVQDIVEPSSYNSLTSKLARTNPAIHFLMIRAFVPIMTLTIAKERGKSRFIQLRRRLVGDDCTFLGKANKNVRSGVSNHDPRPT